MKRRNEPCNLQFDDLAQKDNLSIADIFVAYYNFMKGYLRSFFRYKQTYYNYFFVAYQVLRQKYPISAQRRDGKKRVYSNQNEIWLDMANIKYDSKEDIVYFGDTEFVGGTTNGDIVSVFANKDYQWLPVKDNTVIDIGTNIGDSSIYFAIRGAQKVYAFEPQGTLYKLALRNIELSNLLDIIELTCARCSSESSSIGVPPSFSLEEIINRCTRSPNCLKIDCEGCEYDIIMNSSDRVLNVFEYIIMEYHYGYQNLKQRLEQCGFSVTVSGPVYGRISGPQSVGYSSTISDLDRKPFRRYVGYLYARK